MRFYILKISMVVGLFGLVSLNGYSEGTRRQFLSQSGGVASAALAETFTASGDDVTVMHYNSSLLMNLDKSQVAGTHWFLFDGARFNNVSWAQVTDESAFAMGANQLFRGNIEARRLIDDTPSTANNNQIALNMSGARISDFIGFNYGGTLRYLQFDLAGESGRSFGTDVSLSKKMVIHDSMPKRRIIFDTGFNIRNLYATKMKLKDEPETYPREFVLGLNLSSTLRPRYDTQNNVLRFNTVAFGVDFIQTESQLDTSIGSQYKFSDRFVIRAGWREGSVTAGFGFGLGDFRIDYAYLPKDFTTLHKIGFIYKYGDVIERDVPFTSEFQSVYSKALRVNEKMTREAFGYYEKGKLGDSISLLEKSVYLVPDRIEKNKELLETYKRADAATKSNIFLSSATYFQSKGNIRNAYRSLLNAFDVSPLSNDVLNQMNLLEVNNDKSLTNDLSEMRKEYLSDLKRNIDKQIEQKDFIQAEELSMKWNAIKNYKSSNVDNSMDEHIRDQKALYIHSLTLTMEEFVRGKEYGRAYPILKEITVLSPKDKNKVSTLKSFKKKFLADRIFSIEEILYADKLYYLAAISFSSNENEIAKDYLKQLKEFNPTHENIHDLENSMINSGILKRGTK